MTMIRIDDLLDLDQTEHEELFEEAQFPWDALPMIHEFIEFITKGKRKVDAEVSGEVYIGENVHIGEGTVIEPGVVIQGPAIIGKGTTIRAGAYLRQNVIVGDSCTVGHCTELKNCMLFDHAVAAHFNYIGDSIIGYKAHLGAGVITSNVKTPPSEIKVVTFEESYKTGLTKFGAVIGDKAEVGANAVLNPGTVIGARSIIYPLASVRGVLNSDTILKVRQTQEAVPKREDMNGNDGD